MRLAGKDKSTGDVIFVGDADGPQSVARHRLNHVTYYLFLVASCERLNGTPAVHNPRTPAISTYKNELSQRLVRYCSVYDAILEGAVCCR